MLTDKQQMELANLRQRVKDQREEIKKLRARNKELAQLLHEEREESAFWLEKCEALESDMSTMQMKHWDDEDEWEDG